MSGSLDVEKLEREVTGVYQAVAKRPGGEFHFEVGRPLAERLGYPSDDLDRAPSAAVDSFAGVGNPFGFAALQAGDDVVDLGSGSGMDVFVAALHVGDTGSVTGLDMTEAQLEKARKLRNQWEFGTVSFEHGYIEDIPFDDESFDVVFSNGVINLSADKERVFEEASRVLKSGGRLAVADIVSETVMPDSIKTDADLWAACIGGAEQVDDYTATIESAGFDIVAFEENSQYEFVSEQARGACQKYGVKSISLGARKRRDA